MNKEIQKSFITIVMVKWQIFHMTMSISRAFYTGSGDLFSVKGARIVECNITDYELDNKETGFFKKPVSFNSMEGGRNSGLAEY